MRKLFNDDQADNPTSRFSIAELASATGQSTTEVRSAIRQGVQLGYLRFVQKHPDGTVEYQLTMPPEAR